MIQKTQGNNNDAGTPGNNSDSGTTKQ